MHAVLCDYDGQKLDRPDSDWKRKFLEVHLDYIQRSDDGEAVRQQPRLHFCEWPCFSGWMAQQMEVRHG